MFYTYILKSKKQAGAIYIGYMSDLKKRLAEHNNRGKKDKWTKTFFQKEKVLFPGEAKRHLSLWHTK